MTGLKTFSYPKNVQPVKVIWPSVLSMRMVLRRPRNMDLRVTGMIASRFRWAIS